MSLDLAPPADIRRTPAERRPPTQSAVRVGLVGTGEQAITHLAPALVRLSTARITALVDPAARRRDELADRLGVPIRCDTVEQLLDRGQVDCLIAACPPQAHEDIAAAAVAAGVPFFIEKPPATSTAALAELAAAAARRNVLTGVGMNFRWATPVRHLAALLSLDGREPPAMINVRHMASKPTASMWGMPLWRSFLLAQAIHPIDLVTALTGGAVTDVQPTRRSSREAILIGLQLQFSNGSIGTVVCGNQAPRFEHRIEVTTSGGLTACLTGLTELTTAGTGPDRAGLPLRGLARLWKPSPLDVGYDRTGFGGELAAFCNAVATAGSFTPGLADLLPTYQIMDQIAGSLQ